MKRLTKGRGVDVILDPIGGASFGASYRMLAPLGRLVMLGLSSMSGEKRSTWRVLRSWWAMKSFDPLSLINRNRGVFGLHVGHLWEERRQLQPLMELMMGELAPAGSSPSSRGPSRSSASRTRIASSRPDRTSAKSSSLPDD